MIGGNWKYFRQKRNLWQEEVTKIMHINQKILSRWENDRTLPDIYSLNAR
ncbi:XRE family transcriptional regulator [Leuconostoc pseudomesenteroides]|nr:helix-turn-helix transcriptional regulator [Leuconostoc pseudomesenteroides]MCT4387556.1 XRE family transcriptional regulator [Leuconostoc pseudomesenteroides]